MKYTLQFFLKCGNDGLDVSEAWDAERINSSITSFQSIETSFVPVSNPDIKEINIKPQKKNNFTILKGV